MTAALAATLGMGLAGTLAWLLGYAAAERHHYTRTSILRQRLYVALVTVERLRAERADALAAMDPWIEFEREQG